MIWTSFAIAIQKSNMQKKLIPSMLKENDLVINTTKTEEYQIPYGGREKWKKCKNLGSLQDT